MVKCRHAEIGAGMDLWESMLVVEVELTSTRRIDENGAARDIETNGCKMQCPEKSLREQ